MATISLGIRSVLRHRTTWQIAIPITYIRNVGLEKGDKVKCFMENEKLIIKPIKGETSDT